MANKFSAIIPVGDLTPRQFLMLVSNAFSKLGWYHKGMEENSISASTGMNAASWGEDVTVTVNGTEAEMLSKCTDKQLIDWGKNKRNINKLTGVIADLRDQYTPEQLDEQFVSLKAEAENEQAAFKERFEQGKLTAADKVAIGQGGYYATYSLIAGNILVFIAMVISGVNFLNPSAADLLIWGGNNHIYTASGDWWRLVSSIFLHGGIIHLLFNMYALFSVGIYLEPILGRGKFLAAYFACGILASVTSMAWNDDVTSVGASGAIFGMYGLFLALLTTNYIDKHVKRLLLQSIVIFVAYNLINGLKAGIDNAAHVGGLVSGFLLGYIYYYLHVKQAKPKLFVPIALLLAVIIAVPMLSLKRDDTAKFGRVVDQYLELEGKGLEPLRNFTKLDSASLVQQVESISLPAFREMKALMDKTKNYHLPALLKTRRTLLNQYIDLRIQHTQLWMRVIKEHNNKLEFKMDSLVKQIDTTIQQLQQQ